MPPIMGCVSELALTRLLTSSLEAPLHCQICQCCAAPFTEKLSASDGRSGGTFCDIPGHAHTGSRPIGDARTHLVEVDDVDQATPLL